ncbi:glycosyltransferase [Pseudarthrobacter sp. J64]|uniref:glycosyltransferase n=1 Tax=Pseudarthrobacter sp. J64 TaxID=3116485 RepID=UPI002E815625|nr:glycosyltransferase [Pseudarthrobacter sp. J64]MEE2568484.1 glycosyltransferase [Pseudarthrobacter sp. J64]
MMSNEMNRDDSLMLSVIVPMHNASEKLALCVESLAQLDSAVFGASSVWTYQHEVIFVDDCSTDSTFQILTAELLDRPNWHLLQTPVNSGSPSKPRNIGLQAAKGRYVFFLDGDDEIDPTGLAAAVTLAEADSHDIVRGPVQVYYRGDRRILVDRISPPPEATVTDMLVAIARGQSLNCSALWRRDLLLANNLNFDEGVRMGEDIVFTAAAMSLAESIGYVDTPLFHYVRQPGGGGSAMHYYSGRELCELVNSWQAVEDHFATQGLSYLELHGDRTVNYALRLVIRHHDRDNISEQDVEYFADFFAKNARTLNNIKFVDTHVAALVATLISGEPGQFWEAVKPRLLIAGHDLKFIKPAIPLLRQSYQVQIDEWPTEVLHDAALSSSRLAWADYIWVEWLTAASVWYAERVTSNQRLVVRMHRYELGRSYGDQIKRSSVSAFVAIAPHCLEDMIERFTFDRSKVRFIPNFYFVDSYDQAKQEDADRVFRLGMIGAVPQRKGYLKALALLAKLRQDDDRYSLTVLGKQVHEFPWVANDPLEQSYFSACEEFIRTHDLEEHVIQRGWSNTYKAAKEFGFVLSMSEHEGSHVGPGEAFCAGNQGVFLPWRGDQYVYPEGSVFPNTDAMAEFILQMRDVSAFNEVARAGQIYMKDTYDVSLFVDRVRNLFNSVG